MSTQWTTIIATSLLGPQHHVQSILLKYQAEYPSPHILSLSPSFSLTLQLGEGGRSRSGESRVEVVEPSLILASLLEHDPKSEVHLTDTGKGGRETQHTLEHFNGPT